MTGSIVKKDIRDFSLEELGAIFESMGEKKFRATQVFEWIYQKGAVTFDVMTNLPQPLRGKLTERFSFSSLKLHRMDVSQDETAKYLFTLSDGEKIETVLIPTENRATTCISTQAGCKYRCGFCASGLMGWTRHLTCAEIVSQVMYVKNHSKGRELSHIVFMGIGEPLDNYDNLLKAIRIINAPQGIQIAARRITVSTCGLIPQIKKLANEGMQIELAVSLHGSSQDNRNILMPVNRKYPLADLIATCREYATKTNRQVTFEYILIQNVTCTLKCAEELGRLLKGMLCKINLIPYNPVKEFPHSPPTKMEMLMFKKQLTELGIHATVRMPRGRDVNAACGQLRHEDRADLKTKTITI